MNNKFQLILYLIVGVFINPSHSQEDLEKLYLRKAVKSFVAKNYDLAIDNLEQVLVVSPDNAKAKKLLSKCYVHGGEKSLKENNLAEAEEFFNAALVNDPSNPKVEKGLRAVAKLMLKQQEKRQTAVSQNYSRTNIPSNPVPQANIAQPAQVVVTAPSNTQSDSLQAQVIGKLFKSIDNQQELIKKQIESSKNTQKDVDDSKDKYIEALVQSSEKNSELMRNVLVIGGSVAGGIFFVVLIVFTFLFKSVLKRQEPKAAVAEQPLLLTGPGQSTAQQDPRLLLTSGEQDKDKTSTDSSIDSLNTKDPVKRADAVEAVAAEVIEKVEKEEDEKITKLKELLKDENNRVRANAAKAIYKIDKTLSINTIKDMLKNESKRMRSSAIWVLGEVSSQETLDIILNIEDEDDEILKYNIKVALTKIISNKELIVDEKQKEVIDSIFEKYKELV